MATIQKLQPGQVVYNLVRRAMGNTTMKTTSVYSVRIIEVHEDYVIASWSGSPTKKYFKREVSKWRTNKPTLRNTFTGSQRLATRTEIKEAKEKGTLRSSPSYYYIPERGL